MKKLTSNQLRYLKMQNRIFTLSGVNPYEGGFDESGIMDYIKDEEVLVLPRDPHVLSSFAKWLYTGILPEGFTLTSFMVKNRKLAEYFDDSVVQFTAAAFIHSDTRVALLNVKEHYAYADHTLTMIQGHVSANNEFTEALKAGVIENDDHLDAAIQFNDLIKQNALREIHEEVKLTTEDNILDWISVGKCNVVYYPVSDGLSTHIGVIYDVEMPDEMLSNLTVNEPDKHYSVDILNIKDLYKEIDRLDPWIVAYIATGRDSLFRDVYKEKVFDILHEEK